VCHICECVRRENIEESTKQTESKHGVGKNKLVSDLNINYYPINDIVMVVGTREEPINGGESVCSVCTRARTRLFIPARRAPAVLARVMVCFLLTSLRFALHRTDNVCAIHILD